MVRLEPMVDGEFARSRERSIPMRASDGVRRGFGIRAAALETSRAEFAQRLPVGRSTPNRQFERIGDGASGSAVGATWCAVQEKGRKVRCRIDRIGIAPGHRRRGFTTAALGEPFRRTAHAGAIPWGFT